MRLEPRAQPSRLMSAASPLLALALTAALAALLFAALGKDPLRGLQVFFVEPLRDLYAWTELGVKATPLLLCALGLSVCFRANVWNIGAEGQLLAGAITGGGVALLAGPDSGRLLLPAALAAGVLGGMAWASLAALLRDRFNASEILVSLMLVYVAQLLLGWLVHGPWRDPEGFNFPQSRMFAEQVLLPLLVPQSRLHLGAAIALAAVPLVWLFMFRSLAGYRLQVGGLAPQAARYAGFSPRGSLWTALLLSGGLAGLAGAVEVTGPLGQLTPSVSPGYGFAAIIVAFVGRLHPVGAVLAALLMSMFYIGGELAQTRLGLPSALTGVFQGLLMVALLACDALVRYRVRWGAGARGGIAPGAGPEPVAAPFAGPGPVERAGTAAGDPASPGAGGLAGRA